MLSRRALAAAGLCLLLCWLAAVAAQQPRRRTSLLQLLTAGRHSSEKRSFERRLAAPAHQTWRQRPPPAAGAVPARQQAFVRTSRASSRPQEYDVPIIECPPTEEGMDRFACPTPNIYDRYLCIDDHLLCDGYNSCPGGEDEDRRNCLFYKTTKSHLNVLADALLRVIRG
ncbi:uncharacterized protein LOC122383534 [Amphibalanus amphitrite]|uniref:uncharacterized protein LOC122383534 n=1 Tax=Amphibalanus amphitrite TaxID=1232801 RepID=UPI001C91E80E|nr:uncharacterized protein LOC122383534 [Amphibalanus amphitrite]